MIPEDIEQKLSTVKTTMSKESHLEPDNDFCLKCTGKGCTFVCPAGVYSWDEEHCILNIKYENCLECGACRIACNMQTLKWKYPKSEYGITYKNS